MGHTSRKVRSRRSGKGRKVREEPYICPHCNRAFTTPQGLAAHKRLVHPPDRKPYGPIICAGCGKEFQDSKEAMAHAKSCTPRIPPVEPATSPIPGEGPDEKIHLPTVRLARSVYKGAIAGLLIARGDMSVEDVEDMVRRIEAVADTYFNLRPRRQ